MTPDASLLVLHIAFTAVWFAGPLVVALTLKEAAPKGREAFLHAARAAHRAGRLTLVGNLGTLLSGVALVVVRDPALTSTPLRIHAALGLAAMGALMGAVYLQPQVDALRLRAEDPRWTAADATPALGRVALGAAGDHALWLSALVLMLVPF